MWNGCSNIAKSHNSQQALHEKPASQPLLGSLVILALGKWKQDNQKFKIGLEGWFSGQEGLLHNHKSLSLDPNTHKTSQAGMVVHACDPSTE